MASEHRPRMLLAKPGLDGHDRGAKVVARALRDAGFEVVYTGLHQTPESIVAAAVAEDVDLVGLSVLSGAHLAFTADIMRRLDEAGAPDVLVVVGGIVPDDDVPALRAAGAAAVFPTGANMFDLAPTLRGLLDERRVVAGG